ncbi:MAG: response regulator transcription factor, partial [Chloroflexota bacterium]
MIRTIITDDQALARDGLKMILSASPDIDVVATAENGAQAVDLVEKYKPDLVLMDLKMPVMNGILATRKIIERFPNMKVLVLTTYDADEWVFDAVRAGASGYLLKDATRDEILSAIARVMEGNTQVSPAIADKLYSYVRGDTVPDTTLARKLNPRELEIL